MSDPVIAESRDGLLYSRLDLVAFIAAFVVGLALYLLLHRVLHVPQYITTGAIVSVMVLYGVVVARVSRIRVRLDQAGDNAYYLGLLFTLVSMAFALYEFGSEIANTTSEQQGPSGAQVIIENFGVALASTIAGIFLRVILHQMRVDPADVENMSRIELAEASKSFRSHLANVSGSLVGFHDELRQKNADMAQKLVDDSAAVLVSMRAAVERTVSQLAEQTFNTQRDIIEKTVQLTDMLSVASDNAKTAADRLIKVEPMPLTATRRLDKFAQLLEKTIEQLGQVTSNLGNASAAAVDTGARLNGAAASMERLGDSVGKSQEEAMVTVSASLTKVSDALGGLAIGIADAQRRLTELHAGAAMSATSAEQAQRASTEVLARLTEMARNLAEVARGGQRAAGEQPRVP